MNMKTKLALVCLVTLSAGCASPITNKMRFHRRYSSPLLAFAVLALSLLGLQPALAEDKSFLEQDAQAALASLYTTSPGAQALGARAAGILVFPTITKAGFIIGAQGGSGVLFQQGNVGGFYHSGALSVGMQAGMQTYGYALFFMSDADLAYLSKSEGLSIGVGPSIVVANTGFGKDISSATLKSGIYAFIFDQQGLMAGMGVTGQKITRLK